MNSLVFGRPEAPTPALTLQAGPLTLEFERESGALRYFELPTGLEAVRAVYPTLRRGDWSTVAPTVEVESLDRQEASFSIRLRLAYENGYRASVSVRGDASGVEYVYEGQAEEGFETNRTGLCVLHPIVLADEPIEVRHPDGTRESGRLPDLVQPDWPFREVAGIVQKLPGYRLEVAFEGETFEMEDQRNFGDASFKTYCYPQSRPFPYRIDSGGTIRQTVRISVAPWGARAEDVPPLPEGEAGLLFLDEALPVPLIGLCASADDDPGWAVRAPVDYFRMPADAARDFGLPLELTLDLSSDAEAQVQKTLETIRALPEPPDRLMVSPPSAKAGIAALREALGESVSVLATGGIFADLNRSDLQPADAEGVGFGYHPQIHLTDDATLFENVEAIPDLVATAEERTEGPVIVGPVRLAPGPDPRTGSLLFAAWTVAVLASVARSDADAVTLFDLEGPDGLFRDGRPIPAYHVLRDLAEFADGELIVALGTARRATGFAVVLDERFRAVVANLTPQPLRLTVVAASDEPHTVKILDERSLEGAMADPQGWRDEPGEVFEPVEGAIHIQLGAYGVARIDTEVDELGDGNN